MKITNKLVATGLFTEAIILASSASAANNASTGGFGADVGTPTNVQTDLESAIMGITNYILGFIGLVAILVIIYGGLMYLTAAGNDDTTAKARKTISSGIIGLVICGLAYAMVQIVADGLLANNN